MTMVVTLAVAFFLCSVDVVIRRHGRLLPLGFAGAALGAVWFVHMLTFPAVLPGRLPFVTAQTAPYLFHLGHIGMPTLLVWILLRRTGPLANTRRSLARTVVGSLGLARLCIILTGGLG